MAERYQQRGGYEQGEQDWQQHQESHASGPGLPSWQGGYGSQSGQRPQGGQQSQWDASGGRGGQWRGGGAESHGLSGGQETNGPRQSGPHGSPQGGGYGTHGGGYGSQSSYASHSNYGAEALHEQCNARPDDTSHVGFGGLEYGGGGGSPAQGQRPSSGEHYPTQGGGWGEATHRSPGYQESPINYGQQGQTGYGPSGGYGDPDEPRGSQGYGTQRSGGWATRHGSYAAQSAPGAQQPQHYGGAPGSPGEQGRPPSGTALQSPYPEGPGRSGYSAHGGYAAHGGRHGPGLQQGHAEQRETMQQIPPSPGYGTHGGPGPEAYSRGGAPQQRETPAGSAGAGMRQARRWPRGYQRSDERIKEDIYERLLERSDIEAEEVTVIVDSGAVRLEGSVPRRAMKHAIEDLVDDCPGVKDIDNRLRVTPSGGAANSGGSGGGSSGRENITGGSAASGDQSGTYHSR